MHILQIFCLFCTYFTLWPKSVYLTYFGKFSHDSRFPGFSTANLPIPTHFDRFWSRMVGPPASQSPLAPQRRCWPTSTLPPFSRYFVTTWSARVYKEGKCRVRTARKSSVKRNNQKATRPLCRRKDAQKDWSRQRQSFGWQAGEKG